mmetsp:Transcript_34686/g.77581  ORF Transcript_34686/g.77581 Transcript_34686/m.77581 type:complete len:294 (-) Transcript_34686:179-1060(-)
MLMLWRFTCVISNEYQSVTNNSNSVISRSKAHFNWCSSRSRRQNISRRHPRLVSSPQISVYSSVAMFTTFTACFMLPSASCFASQFPLPAERLSSARRTTTPPKRLGKLTFAGPVFSLGSGLRSSIPRASNRTKLALVPTPSLERLSIHFSTAPDNWAPPFATTFSRASNNFGPSALITCVHRIANSSPSLFRRGPNANTQSAARRRISSTSPMVLFCNPTFCCLCVSSEPSSSLSASTICPPSSQSWSKPTKLNSESCPVLGLPSTSFFLCLRKRAKSPVASWLAHFSNRDL